MKFFPWVASSALLVVFGITAFSNRSVASDAAPAIADDTLECVSLDIGSDALLMPVLTCREDCVAVGVQAVNACQSHCPSGPIGLGCRQNCNSAFGPAFVNCAVANCGLPVKLTKTAPAGIHQYVVSTSGGSFSVTSWAPTSTVTVAVNGVTVINNASGAKLAMITLPPGNSLIEMVVMGGTIGPDPLPSSTIWLH